VWKHVVAINYSETRRFRGRHERIAVVRKTQFRFSDPISRSPRDVDVRNNERGRERERTRRLKYTTIIITINILARFTVVNGSTDYTRVSIHTFSDRGGSIFITSRATRTGRLLFHPLPDDRPRSTTGETIYGRADTVASCNDRFFFRWCRGVRPDPRARRRRYYTGDGGNDDQTLFPSPSACRFPSSLFLPVLRVNILIRLYQEHSDDGHGEWERQGRIYIYIYI